MREENQTENEEISQQFVFLASRLSTEFPELDLRFTLRSGSSKMRFTIADLDSEYFDLDLDIGRSFEALYEAIFAIKQITRTFDA